MVPKKLSPIPFFPPLCPFKSFIIFLPGFKPSCAGLGQSITCPWCLHSPPWCWHVTARLAGVVGGAILISTTFCISFPGVCSSASGRLLCYWCVSYDVHKSYMSGMRNHGKSSWSFGLTSIQILMSVHLSITISFSAASNDHKALGQVCNSLSTCDASLCSMTLRHRSICRYVQNILVSFCLPRFGTKGANFRTYPAFLFLHSMHFHCRSSMCLVPSTCLLEASPLTSNIFFKISQSLQWVWNSKVVDAYATFVF